MAYGIDCDGKLRGMRLAGVRQLVVPSIAGFGHVGPLKVPPGAVLMAGAKLLMAGYDPVRAATLE